MFLFLVCVVSDADIEDMYAAPEVGLRAQARFAKQRANVVNLHDHLSTVPLEYSYFQTSILSLWAGPNHWKIKPVKRGKFLRLTVEKAVVDFPTRKVISYVACLAPLAYR